MSQVTVEQAFQLALARQQAGHAQEAERIYRQILAHQPGHADTWHMLGLLAHRAGNNAAAADLIRRSLALQPHHADASYNLGVVLAAAGDAPAAAVAYRRAIELNPRNPIAHNNLGSACKDLGRFDEAIAAYRQAIALNPRYAEAYNNLGNACYDKRLFPDAITAYQQAIALNPGFAEAYCNLGNTLGETGQFDAAIAAHRQGIALKADFPEAHANVATLLADKGLMEEAIASYRRALALRPNYVSVHSKLIYALSFSPRHDSAAILLEAREFNRRHAAPLKAQIQPHRNDPDPERRLRIGYVSPDFCDHCQSFFTLPLLSHHDRARFEIFCYAHVPRPDAVTARIKACADHWRNTLGQSDLQLADLIRTDRIDILVDLTMHMANNRLLTFARKPAPVQVSWLAYPGTTGLDAIDYRITDPHLDPPSKANDAFYAECSIRLPETFWCYDPLTSEPAVNALPALAAGKITFGCLNNYRKVNADLLKLWARVLMAVKDSRLVLLSPAGDHRARVLEIFAANGVKPDRIVWFERTPRAQYLAAYHAIDIGLDTLFPYNGHTTSLDSFWMGVPVITLSGKTVAGRGGVSQLRNLGLPELITSDEDAFVEIASALAADLPRLSALRQGLRRRMEQSPLMDAPRFARNMEAAYRDMWRRWCENNRRSNVPEASEPRR